MCGGNRAGKTAAVRTLTRGSSVGTGGRSWATGGRRFGASVPGIVSLAATTSGATRWEEQSGWQPLRARCGRFAGVPVDNMKLPKSASGVWLRKPTLNGPSGSRGGDGGLARGGQPPKVKPAPRSGSRWQNREIGEGLRKMLDDYAVSWVAEAGSPSREGSSRRSRRSGLEPTRG